MDWRKSLLLAVMLLTFAATPVLAVQRQDVDAAKSEANSLEKEKKKVEATLKNLESLKNDAAAYVRQLDESLEQLDQELEELEEKIADKEADIETAQEELTEAKAVEADQYAAMKLRIKYTYERGDTSFVDLLLQSKDMGQLLNRAEYIQKIYEYDKQKLDEYAQTKEEISVHEKTLETEREELLALQEETEARQSSVKTLLEEKSNELAAYDAQISAAEGQISEYETSIREQESKIQQMEAEIKRQEEEARKAAEAAGQKYNTVSLGNISFIWPCPSSSRISSVFGDRTSPTEGASTDHKGIDISAQTGASILAAASGTVVIATYSYSAGNYIMINHGGGIYTVYMHCSQLLASEGQEVAQGETIARVGSTGYSTGPHLHFGIRANGAYVNPSLYVAP
ncbi:MAG: peptidoglycan DD-metalloendopeptidase family protein [Clostridiales bacterium]|nr:peptidoglycan DD-metalloendopeptidase family protein [Clostridiales bacterium]